MLWVEIHAFGHEEIFDAALFAQVLRNAADQTFLFVEQPNLITDLECVLDVVSGEKDGLVLRLGQAVEHQHHRHLAWIVEESGGFIKQDDRGFLGDGLGNHHFLTLAVAQVAHLAVLQFAHAHPLHAFLNDGVVTVFQLAPESCVGTASHGHHVVNCHAAQFCVVRQHHAHHLRKLFRLVVGEKDVLNDHVTVDGGLKAGKSFQQRGFSSTVRTKQAYEIAFVEGAVEVGADNLFLFLRAVASGEVTDFYDGLCFHRRKHAFMQFAKLVIISGLSGVIRK